MLLRSRSKASGSCAHTSCDHRSGSSVEAQPETKRAKGDHYVEQDGPHIGIGVVPAEGSGQQRHYEEDKGAPTSWGRVHSTESNADHDLEQESARLFELDLGGTGYIGDELEHSRILRSHSCHHVMVVEVDVVSYVGLDLDGHTGAEIDRGGQCLQCHVLGAEATRRVYEVRGSRIVRLKQGKLVLERCES